MRLLKVNADGGLRLCRFTGSNIPSYAILSHTWEADEQEVSFQDIMNGAGHTKTGYKKLRFCKDRVQKDGLSYFWIDSVCIDQSSSMELSTAINSMFRWYRNATKCYVYLSDVSATIGSSWEPSFDSSRWFTRGWTLQELLAPGSAEFFSQEGVWLGSKYSLEDKIQAITGIPTQALRGDPLSQISIEERMSWIANRETTIEEDLAYSILGIFDIHMPLIYGEGAIKGLRRLGEELEKSLTFNRDGESCRLYQAIADLRSGFVTEGKRMSPGITHNDSIICRLKWL
jgi:hypothetical protein